MATTPRKNAFVDSKDKAFSGHFRAIERGSSVAARRSLHGTRTIADTPHFCESPFSWRRLEIHVQPSYGSNLASPPA